MDNILLNGTEFFCLDLDGTFGEITPRFSEHCLEVLADTVLRLGAPLTKQEALAEARLSHKECSSCFSVFRDKYNISVEKFNEVYHEGIDFSLSGPCHVDRDQLLNFPFPIAILSHSSEQWIIKYLKQWGLEDIIPQERIIAIEKMDYELKTSQIAYRKALDLLGWPAERTAMVEDTPENLVFAKKILRATVLVTHNRSFNSARYRNMDSYVDVRVENLSAFMNLFTPKFCEVLYYNAQKHHCSLD